jgi:putative hydrolase of the HAD superfamily
MIDTLLFDLDDTLMIEWKSAQESFIETARLANLNTDSELFVKTVREQARKLWYTFPTIEYCLKVGISSWEALWGDFTGEDKQLKNLKSLAPGYRLKTWYNALLELGIDDENLALKLSNEFKRIRNTKHFLFPETQEILNELKPAFTLGLITNGAPDIQWKKINGGNLKNYFAYITVSGEHGMGKPDKRLFSVALKHLKANASETLMIGNNLKTDIEGAKNAGIKTIWINRNNQEGNGKADFEIKNLFELKKIVANTNDNQIF